MAATKNSPLVSLILTKLREYSPTLRWRAAEDEDGTTFQAKLHDRAGTFFVEQSTMEAFSQRDQEPVWLDLRKLAQTIQRDLRKAAK